MAKKMGLPNDRLKDARVTARVDSEVKKIREDYCEKNRISIVEGLRHAILKLSEDKKQEGNDA